MGALDNTKTPPTPVLAQEKQAVADSYQQCWQVPVLGQLQHTRRGGERVEGREG
jgi:hypothetical protein